MLVLGMASMANAQMYLTINGTDNPTDAVEALVGDVLTIDIYGDGYQEPGYFFMDVDGVFTWDISQATINYQGSWTAISINDDFPEYLNIPFICFMLDDVPPFGQNKKPLGPYPKPLIDTILLTVGLGEGETEATNTITLYDQDLTYINSFVVGVEIPEPMMVALMGLGGLALRRNPRNKILRNFDSGFYKTAA